MASKTQKGFAAGLTVDEQELHMRKLEDELANVKILNEALNQKLFDTEREAKRIRDAYEALTSDTAAANEAKRNAYISKPLKPSATGNYARLYTELTNTKQSLQQQQAAAENDARIIRTLRCQVEDLTSKLDAASNDIKHLKGAVATREQELRKNVRSMRAMENHAHASGSSTGHSGDGSAHPLDGPTGGADAANKRIIDMLHGQVDFLSETVAAREAQIKEMAATVRNAEQYKYDVSQKNEVIALVKSENAKLNSQLRLLHEQLRHVEEVATQQQQRAAAAGVAIDGSAFTSSGAGMTTDSLHTGPMMMNPLGVASPAMDISYRAAEAVSPVSLEDDELDAPRDIRGSAVGSSSAMAARQHSGRVSPRATTTAGKPASAAASSTAAPAAGNAASLNRELMVWKQEVKSLKAKLQQLESENKSLHLDDSQKSVYIKSLKSDIEELQHQLDLKQEVLEETQTNLQLTTKQLRETEGLLERAEQAKVDAVESYRLKQSQLQITVDELNRTIVTMKHEKMLLESQAESYRRNVEAHQMKVVSDREESTSLNAAKDAAEGQALLLQAQVAAMEASLKQQTHSSAALKSALDSSIADNKQLQGDIVELKKRLADSGSREKSLIEKQKSLFSEQQQRTSQITDVSVTINQLEREISQRDSHISDLEADLQLARSRVHEYELQAEEIRSDDKRSSSVQESTKSQYQALVERFDASLEEALKYKKLLNEAKAELDACNKHIERLKAKAIGHENEKRQLMEETESIQNKYNDLQVLYTTTQSTMKLQAQKQNQLQGAVQMTESEKEELLGSISMLKEELAECQAREKQLDQAYEELMEERNELVATLNEQESELSTQNQMAHSKDDQQMQLRQAFERTETKLRAVERDYVGLQRQYGAMELRYNDLTQENMLLRRKQQEFHADLAGAASDLRALAEENQTLQSNLATAVHEKEMVLAKYTDVITNVQQLQQSRRAVEIERDDVLQNYRTTLQEKKKLENDIRSLGVSRQESGMKLNEMITQIAELKGQVNSHIGTENRWNMERVALNKHLESLNEASVKLQRKLDAVEADNRRLMQDNYNYKESVNMLNERIQLIIKRSNNASDNNKILVHKLSSVERERDALRTIITTEKQRVTDMETLLHTNRVRHATSLHAAAAGASGNVRSGGAVPSQRERGEGSPAAAAFSSSNATDDNSQNE